MKRRRNNGSKFTGAPLGVLIAGTQIVRLDATLNIRVGPAGGEILVCYTMDVFVNYN